MFKWLKLPKYWYMSSKCRQLHITVDKYDRELALLGPEPSLTRFTIIMQRNVIANRYNQTRSVFHPRIEYLTE